jgi:hypothetical protein
MEANLQPWLPAGRLRQLEERRRELERLLRMLQAGHLKSLSERFIPGPARWLACRYFPARNAAACLFENDACAALAQL